MLILELVDYFFNAGPGYGGSCLPKDLETIIQFSSKIGTNPILLKAVQQINDLQIKQIIHAIGKKSWKLLGINVSQY